MTSVIRFYTKFLQQFLEIGLPLLRHPLFSALPVLCEPSRKHARVIGKQVFLEKLRVAQLLIDIIYKMRRPELFIRLSWYFNQAAAVAVRLPVHNGKQHLSQHLGQQKNDKKYSYRLDW